VDIELNRGSSTTLKVSANIGNIQYTFQVGDVVRLSVTEKKNESNVVLRKDVEVVEEANYVEIPITSSDSKIGELINKPAEYWYEIELNPSSENCQTIIGYDEDGPKIFRLYPESGETTNA
jgi:hypothetical protein